MKGHHMAYLAGRTVLKIFLALALAFSPPSAVAKPLVNGKGLLWKVARQDIDPSYLFGTIHATDKRVHALPPEVARALAASRSLTLEIVLTDKVKAEMAMRMVIRDGRTLDQLLGPALFNQVVGVGKRYGLGRAQLKIFKPWALFTIFGLPPAEQARQGKGLPSLDEALRLRAVKAGKMIHQLETTTEQLDVLDGFKEPLQIGMLRAAVKDNAKAEHALETMITYYLARDISGLRTWMLNQMTGPEIGLYEKFEHRVITARNRRMAKRMKPRLKEGHAFIAIGAMHLPGRQGIVRLLELADYKVKRVY